MRALALVAVLAFAVPVLALAPSTARALEQDGVHLATYNSIMECDVDIRSDLYKQSPPGTVDGAIAETLDAVKRDSASSAGAKKELATWTSTLEKGLRNVRSAKGDARVAALKALHKDMGPMIEEAKAKTGR
jgi:hypothetical protein